MFDILEISKIDPGDPAAIENFPTIYRQTGTIRQGPVAIIQDHATLCKVKILNYDWTIPEFAEYCSNRGVPCFDVLTWVDLSPKSAHIHGAKLQDAWELWLREIKALPEEDYTKKSPFTDLDRLDRLLQTIYKI